MADNEAEDTVLAASEPQVEEAVAPTVETVDLTDEGRVATALDVALQLRCVSSSKQPKVYVLKHMFAG